MNVLVFVLLHEAAVCTNWKKNLIRAPYKELLLDDQDLIRQQRLAAESLFQSRQGYLWIQQSKGGWYNPLYEHSSQCSRVDSNRWQQRRRRTGRCLGKTDHLSNLFHLLRLQHKGKVPSRDRYDKFLQQILDQHGQNFLEFENNGVPADLTTSTEEDAWNQVTTIRHPLERITSLLFYDPSFACCHQNCTESSAHQCVTKMVGDMKNIMTHCSKGLYLCMSNYYVRQFAGLGDVPNHFNTAPPPEELLVRAQRNFHRFSCVVVQEEWASTISCLKRLGLFHYSEDVAFNQNGQLEVQSEVMVQEGERSVEDDCNNGQLAVQSKVMVQEGERSVEDDCNKEDKRFPHLPKETQALLRKLNAEDLQFYEWARNEIRKAREAETAPGTTTTASSCFIDQ